MNLLHTPWPYLTTASIVFLTAIYAWKQPHRPIIRYFFWVLGLWGITTLTAAFTTMVRITELRYVLWVLQIIGLQLAFSVELMFSLEYTGNEKWINLRSLALIFTPALITALLLIVLPMDRLVSVEMYFGTEVIVTNEFGHLDNQRRCSRRESAARPGFFGAHRIIDFGTNHSPYCFCYL
jgi:hypothetical protein